MMSRYAIGGEFELNALAFKLPSRLCELTRGLDGAWTISGRAALALILQHLKARGVRHVHLPAFLCQSILQPVRALGLEYSFYRVSDDLMAHPDPPLGSAVLIIHYFGWINQAAGDLRAEAGRSFHVIEDASQALLSDWEAEAEVPRFVILSPRKFGPSSIGGWCNLQAQVEKPSQELEILVWRSLAARLARGAYLAEPGSPVDANLESFYLSAFRDVEAYLDAHPAGEALPQIALDLIAGLDWADIAARRCKNWQRLHELLAQEFDMLIATLPQSVVPLGYVIRLPERDAVLARLARSRIFCPVHWPLPAAVDAKQFPEAANLSKTLLTLPIDQRYNASDMAFLAEALKQAV